MSIGFGLGLGIGQSQKLTPQMQQAIKLLQLSAIELEQVVQEKLDSNPLLERQEEDEDGYNYADEDRDRDSQFDDQLGGSIADHKYSDDADYLGDEYEPDARDKLDSALDNDAIDQSWQDVYSDRDLEYSTANSDNENDIQQGTSFCIADHVRWQMNFKHLSDLDKLIAEHLIDAMNDKGFIEIALSEVAAAFNTQLAFYESDIIVDEAQVRAVLTMVQSCSPTGVGARNLAECLRLQLNVQDCHDERWTDARAVLDNAELLRDNNIKALKRATGLDDDALTAALAVIRTLNPDPVASFVPAVATSPDVPDVLVVAHKLRTDGGAAVADSGGYAVSLNPRTLPRLTINKEYASLVKKGDDSRDGKYLKEALSDAKVFLRSIEERNQNLLKVATEIVRKQQAFMQSGAAAMNPLTLKEVADAVGVHESTVSRLTANKTMLTPQGLFALKYFFSSHIDSSGGEISSTAIIARLKEMITDEDPKKPLSDSELARRLAAQGIEIARRTVAKYREAMGVASSSERKRRL